MADYVLSAKITGDASEFAKAFKRAEETASSFKSKMSNIGSGFSSVGKSLTNLGNSLTSHITKPAAIAATALAGVTLAKGWSRMSEIDNAKVKLEAIGNSAEDVKEIMDNATSSVKGTAYGLNEAATTAASAVAAGIKPGQELQGYLSSVADAAAVAGIDMQSMGSIFNKVATQGKANNEVLQQMAEAGIPIYQYLADELGVTADQVFDMASRGEIDLATFQKSVETHIGGAAQTIGSKTITGAISNIGASISRIGANFLGSADDAGSFAGQVLPLLNDFKAYLGGVEEKAKEWGAVFGQVFGSVIEYCRTGSTNLSGLSDSAAGIVEKLIPVIDKVKAIASAFAGLSPKMQVGLGAGVLAAGPLLSILGKVVSGVGGIITVIGAVGSAFGTLSTKIAALGGMKAVLSSVFASITGPVGIAIMAITGLVAAFAYLMTTNDSFRASIMNSVSTIIGAVVPIIQQIGTLLGSLAKAIFPVVLDVINQLAPVLAQIVEVVAQVLASLGPIVSMLISSLAPVIQTIVTVIMNIVQAVAPALISIINVILSVIQAIAPVVMDIISVVASVISSIISIISPIIAFIGGVISAIISIIAPIVSFIANIIAAIVSVIGTIIGVVTGIFSTVFSIVSGTFQKVSSVVTSVINGISSVISTISGVFSRVFNACYSVVSGIMNKVRSVITGVFNSIKSAWNGLTSFVSGVFDGIGSAVKKLVNTVKGFINGVIGGINTAIGLINKIPGVSISKIPKLAHGTDNWQGGFAVMNEGGRGELVNLPNGAQVIPHDVSVKYAKEAARTNTTATSLDMSGFMEGMIIQIVNNTNVDGTPLKETVSDYTIRKIGNQQKAVLRARGAY